MTKKEFDEKVLRVVALSMELFEERSDHDANTNLPVAFVNVFGHVGMVEVRLFANGWESGYNPTGSYQVYTDDLCGKCYRPERLDEIIEEMERLAGIRYQMQHPDEKICKNCVNRSTLGKICDFHKGRKIELADTCENWFGW